MYAKTEQESLVQLAAWQELASNLIEATAAHAIRWNESSHESFRQGLTDILTQLKSDPSSSSVQASAGAASQSIEAYQRDTQEYIDTSLIELQDMIRMLMASITDVQKEYGDSAGGLLQIQERIQQTRTVDDLRVAKADLFRALSRLRDLASEGKQKSSDLVQSLQDRVRVLEQSASSVADSSAEGSRNLATSPRALAPDEEPAARGSVEPPRRAVQPKEQLDSVTGLPDKDAVTEALRNLPPSRKGMYLSVFYLKRMEYLNARFGDEIGDEVLVFCSELITSRMIRPTDRLYRWRGPSFCALLEREDALPGVRSEIRRNIGPRLGFERANGSLMLSIGVAADVLSVGERTVEELLQEIERFLVLPATRS